MIVLWCARVGWAVLPITAGVAFADALEPWSSAPATVAAVLLWAAWTAGLVALLAPRPLGITVLRVVAPAAVVLAFATLASTPAGSGGSAVISAAVAAALVLSAPVSAAASNSSAYGDEMRFPLRIPVPLLVTVVPAAVVLVASGIAAGPLLLADERYVVGAIAAVLGAPAVAFFGRALHSLSRRWFVLVPAGVVFVDPLTLLDPALVRREQITSLEPGRATSPGATVADLRLGTPGGLCCSLREPVGLGRRSGRKAGVLVESRTVLFAPVRPRHVLAAAARRRLPAHETPI